MHTQWKNNCKLQPQDGGVTEHESLCKMMEVMGEYDQLSDDELAVSELMARRIQMLQYKRKDRLLNAASSTGIEEESHYFLGTDPSRGNLCISPTLQSFLGDEMHKESMREQGDPQGRSGTQLALRAKGRSEVTLGEKLLCRIACGAARFLENFDASAAAEP